MWKAFAKKYDCGPPSSFNTLVRDIRLKGDAGIAMKINVEIIDALSHPALARTA